MKRAQYELLEKLMDAVSSNNTQEAKVHIANGAPINGKIAYGKTPMMVAAERGNSTMVLFLKNHGARVNAYDEDGEHVLFYALSAKEISKKFDTIKTLLMLKCDVDVTSEYNEAFFSRAVYYFTPTQLQEFSLLGLPMYLVGTEQEESILHLLATSSKVAQSTEQDAIAYLVNQAVEEGANLQAVNVEGLTPWEVALKQGNKNMVQALEAVGARLGKDMGSILLASIMDPKRREEVLDNCSIEGLKDLRKSMAARLKTENRGFFKLHFEELDNAISRALLKKSVEDIQEAKSVKQAKI